MQYKDHLSILLLLPVLILLFQAPAAAQQVDNVDTAFEVARQLAFDGDYSEARSLARAILDISPNYHDVRILLARTYSWNGEYQEAREQLHIVLNNDPDYRDALIAAIDNELWAENPDEAVLISNSAVNHYPMNETLLLKNAEAHRNAGMEKEALRILDKIDQINPSSEDAGQLRRSINITGLNYTLTASYTYDWFSDVFDPWQKGHIQLSRKTPAGSIIGRLNYADRFEKTGLQPEIDFYPGIVDGLYGYLNFGYTNNNLYPKYRVGAELYKRLPKGFEASAGFRHLRFQNGTVTIYTGSLSKYWGSWYFSARPYLTPSSAGVSRSINLTARRYTNGPENYVTFRSGFGFSPEERRFQDISGDIFLVESQYVGVDVFKTIRYNLAFFGALDAARQELRFDPGRFIQVYTLNAGIQVKF